MKTVEIDLGSRSYPIHIGSGLLTQSDWPSRLKNQQICIVTNETIAPLYLAQTKALFKDKTVIDVILPDGEKFKSLDTLALIFDGLIDAAFDRTCVLIALGGGVVGDITGYAAASYQRGVDFVQIPTTLLAQVDSSVGGKTGVNHPRGKNMIGAFHQPKAVITDLDILKTLPDREFSAGMAEVIKYGAIMDSTFLQWLDDNADALLDRDVSALQYAIARSCECKAQIVAEDELEGGRRALLNFGHTYGHALESLSNYSRWLHGEAVAIGMTLASEFSMALGGITAEAHQQLVEKLQKFNLPISADTDITSDSMIASMLRDKKSRDGNIRLVLLEGMGNAFLSDQYDRKMFTSHLEKVFAAD
ncbi:MAG: 3-dehydroquinate synthase [Gammaproteobacteria bacterium]|nr:3-dehydroquinate synthase [Gammaproteobacteria bacterium]